MKPFRGKRIGPQSPPAEFNLAGPVLRGLVGSSVWATAGLRLDWPRGALSVGGAPRPVLGPSRAPAEGSHSFGGGVIDAGGGPAPGTEGNPPAPGVVGRLWLVRLGGTARSAVRPLATSLLAASPGCPQGLWRPRRHPIRPVLKHGPRSLTRARVTGLYETQRHNESEGPPSRWAQVGSRWLPVKRTVGRTTGPSQT